MPLDTQSRSTTQPMPNPPPIVRPPAIHQFSWFHFPRKFAKMRTPAIKSKGRNKRTKAENGGRHVRFLGANSCRVSHLSCLTGIFLSRFQDIPNRMSRVAITTSHPAKSSISSSGKVPLRVECENSPTNILISLIKKCPKLFELVRHRFRK